MSRGLTVTSQLLDSKTLPWLAIPATQAPVTQCDNSGKRDKKKGKKKAKGGMEGRQKTKNLALPLKKRKPLRENKRLHYALPNVVPNSRYSEPRDLREPEHIHLRPRTVKQPLHPGPQCTRKPASLCC